ncbi:MAG: SDR family oxidoreductase [Rhodothermales bacterium]
MPLFVITGASQGMGRAIAEIFSGEENVQLALIARNEANLKEVAVVCEAQGAEVAIYPCDVTDEKGVADVATRVIEQWGAPDVLINNAGVFQPGGFLETTLESFKYQLDVNLTSAFMVTQGFLQSMIDKGAGTLFYMASVASLKAYPGGAAYCTAKHGLLGLARSVREETRDKGLRVTTLLPGATLTPSWDGVDIPEERFMPATDIAKAVRDIYHMSDRTVVEEVVLRPQLGDI